MSPSKNVNEHNWKLGSVSKTCATFDIGFDSARKRFFFILYKFRAFVVNTIVRVRFLVFRLWLRIWAQRLRIRVRGFN